MDRDPKQSARRLLEESFRLAENEGADKVAPLGEAIRRHVEPRDTIHIARSSCWPSAAMYELLRIYRGADPGFTFSSIGFTLHSMLLVHAGLAQKIITSYAGDSYPTPGPNPVFERAYLDRSVEFENWTMLTITLRLLAGAMGVPALPTRSMLGSGMAEENKSSFFVMEDPRETGEQLGLVAALRPDVTLLHGCAADRNGNVLFAPPYGDDIYGGLASRRGVIATVEKIVSTGFIRRYNHLAGVPSYAVLSVSEIPYGGHPSGISNRGLADIESYAEDYEFISELRAASRDPRSLDRWLDEWVNGCRSHDDYIARLGSERLAALRRKAEPDSWRPEIEGQLDAISRPRPPSSAERMIIESARQLAARCRAEGYRTVLAGVGASNLAAWLAVHHLKREGRECELMAEIGFYGYAPRPADPYIFNYRNLHTCKILTGIHTILGPYMSGENARCIGAIGAAQIDRRGNVNTTKIPGERYLLGSGGANDIAMGARETLVTALLGKKRFVEKVSYLTTPGTRVRAVVSNGGIFEKPPGDGDLVLTGVFAEGPSGSLREAAERVRSEVGWPLRVAEGLERLAEPDPEDVLLLRIYDPKRQFLGKGEED